MAKGFGSILAQVSVDRRAAEFTSTPVCHLCGEIMDGGAAWFCTTHRDEHIDWLAEHRQAAYTAQEQGEPIFFLDLRLSKNGIKTHQNWDPDMQCAILAVAQAPDGEVIYFSTGRGYGGKTAFSVSRPRQSEWVPQPEDWQWAEWTGK